MKKLLSLLLLLALLIPVSANAVTLSEMTFDELVALREKIAVELTKRPEWKEVTVPKGTWKVGEDIPAGHWHIRAFEGTAPWVIVGCVLEDNGLDVSMWNSSMEGFYYKAELESPSYIFYKAGKSIDSFDIQLKDGLFVQILNGSVLFSPYIGKPTLGF